MRHSLLVRWLAVTLTIALGSIVATAALATYGTTEQLKQQSPESSSLVEADNAILQALNQYAAGHRSWGGVEDTVRELADQFGRRIALTTPDGTVLADSHQVQLPSNAVATIDAARDAAEQTAYGVAGGSTLAWTPASMAEGLVVNAQPVWTEESVRQTEVCVQHNDESVQDVVLAAGVPMAVRSTDVLRVEGEDATRIGDKLVETTEPGQPSEPTRGERAEHGDSDPDSGRAQSGKSQAGKARSGKAEPSRTKAAPAEIELLDLSGDPCLPTELKESTARSKQIDQRQNHRLRRCLDQAGIEYVENDGRLGGPAVELTEAATNAGSERQVHECSQQATEYALQGFVAPPALLYLGTSDRFDAFSAQGFWRTATMAFAVLLAAALVTVLAGRRMVRPIQALTGAAQRVAAGDHDARVPESGRDEVARMGAAFNRMAESVQAGERQRKAMVSDVAHELRNPLANVRGYLEAVEDGVVELDAELVGSLQEEARLLDRLVDDLQDLALADAGELRLHPERCDLAELAGQVATVHQAQAEHAGVSLTVRTVGDAAGESGADTVLVDPARMRQAIGNLVSNALAYTSEGGQVVVEVRDRAVTVSDTGVGIAAEHLPHLFDRFYRADSSRSRRTGGSGLGLAITRHLVQAHGGTIDVRSTVGEGTSFTLRLPPPEDAGLAEDSVGHASADAGDAVGGSVGGPAGDHVGDA